METTIIGKRYLLDGVVIIDTKEIELLDQIFEFDASFIKDISRKTIVYDGYPLELLWKESSGELLGFSRDLPIVADLGAEIELKYGLEFEGTCDYGRIVSNRIKFEYFINKELILPFWSDRDVLQQIDDHNELDEKFKESNAWDVLLRMIKNKDLNYDEITGLVFVGSSKDNVDERIFALNNQYEKFWYQKYKTICYHINLMIYTSDISKVSGISIL